jgi:CubicO group peptidase (beta-lactamase class C family)
MTEPDVFDVDAIADALDELCPDVLRVTGTPGLSVAVDSPGERLERAYGWADVAARRPMSAATVFPAGSMTKLYTAVAVLQLIEHGVVGLHDPVNRHLDGIDCTNPLGAREVTIHDLLTFRSGLGVDTTACRLDAPPPLAEHVGHSLSSRRGQEYAGAAPRWTSRVGERYHYANLGLSILGLVVELRNPDRLPFPAYVHERILRPLGMGSSALSDFVADPPDDLATGYAVFRDFKLPTPWIRSADFPANGLFTTPGDHLRLLSALRVGGGELLSRLSLDRMLTPQVAVADDVSPGGWWTGLVAILANLGRRDFKFGQPGAHEWGWWNFSWAYPVLDGAVVVCTNGWDMMRWHNPANPTAAALVADHVAALLAGRAPRRSQRSYVAGAILAERTYGLLGVGERIDDATIRTIAARAAAGPGWDGDAFMAGLREGGRSAMTPEAAAELLLAHADDTLLLDLGAVYGFPAPLWFWDGADIAAASARSTAAAMAR